MRPHQEVSGVKRYLSWTLVAVIVALAAGKFHASRRVVVYQPSDPALLSATGRPQVVEFYHRT